MESMKDFLPSRLYSVMEKAGISNPKNILIMSDTDIKSLTRLNNSDISLIKSIAAQTLDVRSVTGYNLLKTKLSENMISSGCKEIDDVLKNGFRTGTINELFGESGSGKTQIALQAVVQNWSNGCIYICTEDLFPVKRFDELIHCLPNYSSSFDYGRNIFIEHVTEVSELICCVKVRLSQLLQKQRVKLIVIDSVAAPFRTDSTDYVHRAEELRIFALSLISVAQKYNLAILCVNQVTEFENVLPSLGLAWSNLISTRLFLKKTSEIVSLESLQKENIADRLHLKDLTVRQLKVAFSSYLPNNHIKFVITPSGIKCV